MSKSIFTAVVLLTFARFAAAQDLGSTLSKVGNQYGEAYVTPAANAFGMDLNSGLFRTANVGGMLPFGLNLYVGVQVGGTLLKSSDKSFSLTYQDTMQYTDLFGNVHRVPATFTATNVPTVFGSKQRGVVKETPNDPLLIAYSQTDTTIGGLVHTSIAPLPIPQVGLGSLFGTDAFVRFLPKVKISNYGSAQLFGFGVRHSISQYIPLIPVDIAVQVGWQNFSIADTAGSKAVKVSTFAANVEVSKTLAILTVYAGLQTEKSTMDVNYTYTPSYQNAQPVPISFSIKGKNSFRALLGLNLGLGALSINADYDIGAVSAVTAGIGVTI